MTALCDEEVWGFLEKRRSTLQGVVLSGGEPTMSADLNDIIERIRDMGFKVKLDTNGSNPKILFDLIEKGLIDYVAMDYKSHKEKFFEITKTNFFDKFFESLSYLISCEKVPFELRTTVHTDLLNEDDINIMIDIIDRAGFNGNYYLQNFRQADTIEPLPEQSRIIDIALIKNPSGFLMHLRNF